ncbi:unnamed protein product [Calypogeia fissa]
MDSAEIVTQQPVSTLPDLVSDAPLTREGLLAATVEATSLNPTEPVAMLSKPETLPMSVSPNNGQVQEVTNDFNGNVEKVVDSSISTGRLPPNTAIVQQIKDGTVDIEVELAVAAATDAESRFVVSSMQQEEGGHVGGLLIAQADGKSKAEEIAVEVVLNDVMPHVSDEQPSSSGDGGGGDLGEVLASVELVVETAGVMAGKGSSNVAENRSTQHSGLVANAGSSVVEIEAVVVSDADNTFSSTAIAVVVEQDGAGTEEAERNEHEITSIAGLEQVGVEVVMSDPVVEENVSLMEKDSSCILRFEEETSIEEPQLMNNSEGEKKPLVDIQLGTGDTSAAAIVTTEEVFLVAVSEEALNASDLSSVDVNNLNAAPELESSAAVMTLDQHADIAKEPLNVSDSSVTRIVGGPGTAAELDSNNLVTADGGVMIMRELGSIAGSTSITTNEIKEESIDIRVVNHTEEVLSTEKNAGPTEVSEIGDIPTVSCKAEMEELSNSEDVKIIETSSVHLVETTEMLGPTEETNVEVRLSTDEVIEEEISLETATEILIQTHQDKIENPQESSLKTEMAEEETVIQTVAEKFQQDTGVKSSEERAEQQEVNTKVTKDARIPLDETMNNVNNLVDITAVEKGEDTEMVDAPAAKQEGEAVPITKSMELEDSAAPIDEDLIDPEAGVVAVEETIDTTISITKIQHDKIEGDLIEPEGVVVAVEETVDTNISTTTIQQDNGGAEAEDVDGHGVLIGVGSSVESSGLTITEIADNTVQVEEFQVEQQSGWVLSDEPLITPPEEEIIDPIEDLCGIVDDIVDEDEPPQSTETLLLVVTEDDARNNESNDFLPTPFDRETQIPSETTASALNSQHAAQSERQTTSATVVVDKAEPLDLQDEQPLVPTLTQTEMESVHIARNISPPLTTPPETMQPTNIVGDIALQEGSVQGQQGGIPAIIAEIVDLSAGDEGVSLPIEVLSSDPHSVEKKVADEGTSLTPAFECHPVSISMSSCCERNLSSIEESATAIVEPVARVDLDNTTEGDTSEVLAPITSELGFGLEAAAVDKSVLSEARAMESAESSEVAPVVVADMDGRNDEQVVECALDGSAYIVVDELETVEALERNEKKRARQEEGNAVVEDSEKTSKAAKTSNGEVSLSCDVGTKIGEDFQVDKKRSRDEMEIVAANPDVSIQTKVQKTETVYDNDVPQSHKADSDEEAEVEECVDMEDKEEVPEKSANGAGQDSTAPRYKKRKIALFLGYCGAGYQGMQKNPGAITIEGELEEALFRAGAIAESNYGQPKKLDWRRAARTDKGVSAVGQVVSGCFFIDPPGFIDRVNSHLPKQIRVYGYKRATAGFNAKKLCDRRKYEYVLPVYAFDRTVHLDRETAQGLAAAQNDNSMDQIEISASTIETEASVVIESEMKETTKVEKSTEILVEPVGVTETDVSSISDASNSANPKIEGKQDNKSSSNGMSTVTEEVNMVTVIAKENVATGVKVRTEETLVEMKEVNMADTEVQPSPKEKEALNEKASTARVEVLVQTKEVSTERTEVTVAETVIDMSAEEKKEALDEKVKNSDYKFDEAEFIRLNRILKGFEGHHNFHNFTARTKATDPSANRYIISFEVENTFTIDGVEFVRCSVVGQSFMLHQIRKMIGLAVAIMRGTAPESILATALRKDTKINVPMAPELGLFLEECYYSAYNRRFKVTHEEMSLSSFSAEVNEFKKEFIYPHIGSTEARDSTFAMWLHSLNDRHYPDFVAAREAEKLVESQ